MNKEKKINNKELIHTILEGIQDKKGKGIINVDLKKVQNAICQNFIICHGDSNTQVNAIADSVEGKVIEELNQKTWHKEGYGNCHWILLDYFDTVVHIFQKEYRDFYKLEDLWADAHVEHIEVDY